jgi:anti-sigma B factor antagonist
MSGGELHEVLILGLPLELHRRARDHQATLQRELDLVAAAHDPESAPARLRALSEQMTRRFSDLTEDPSNQLETALESGGGTLDLRVELPADAADAVEILDRALDEVEDFCREGQLLTLLTPPDAVAYRRWFLRQVTTQLRRGPPVRWEDSPEARAAAVTGQGSEPPAPTHDGVVATVTAHGDLDMALAADLRAELVARLDAGAVDLVVDLHDCDFIDSAGLSLLLTTRARCLDRGGSLRVTGVTRPVRRAMEIAEVYAVLTGESE